MLRQDETQRPIHGMLDADAGRDQHFGDDKAVVADLKRGCGIEQIDAIVRWSREAERLAKTAGT